MEELVPFILSVSCKYVSDKCYFRLSLRFISFISGFMLTCQARRSWFIFLISLKISSGRPLAFFVLLCVNVYFLTIDWMDLIKLLMTLSISDILLDCRFNGLVV